MNDSKLREALDDKRERNREHRIESIKHWVEFVGENPPEVWGPQQNRLVDSQLRSARESGLDADHYRRVERAARERQNVD